MDNNYIHRDIETVISEAAKYFMTYSPTFTKALQKVNDWIKAEVKPKTIVYTGDLEDQNGDIRLINFHNL